METVTVTRSDGTDSIYDSTMPEELFEADPLKVEVETWGPKKKYETTLVTPFAGKNYCLKQYLNGLSHLPTKDMAAIWYDNSNDYKFHNKLKKLGRSLFGKFKLLTDHTPHQTIDCTSDYAKISWRCHQVYRTIQEHLNGSPYTFVIEDDVVVPKHGYGKLMEII